MWAECLSSVGPQRSLAVSARLLDKSGSPGGWGLNSLSNPSWGPDSGLHEALEGG